MTGKDFSGPTPEIRVPERLRLDEEEEEQPVDDGAEQSSTKGKIKPRKKSRTPSMADVEVLGDVETFDLGDGDSS